jgi:hypothetical protein
MDDEKRMPESLESIAQKISALGHSIDERFAKVDQQFADMKAQLGVKIEAVDANVDLVYDAVIALQQHVAANATDHERFTATLDNHELRLLALGPRKPIDR